MGKKSSRYKGCAAQKRFEMKPNVSSYSQDRSTGQQTAGTPSGEREANTTMKTWRNAAWLAGKDIRRTWFSYLFAGVVWLLVGIFTTTLLNGVFELEGFGAWGERVERGYNNALLDLWFLAMCPALMINLFFNQDYSARFTKDNMSRRISFLRGLPISARELVLERVLLMLLSLAITAPIFFLIPYLLSDVFSLSLAETTSWIHYLWFVLIWIGYTLFAGGFYLYGWLGFSKKGDVRFTAFLVLFWLSLVGAMNWGLGIGIVSATIGLIESFGSSPALLASLVGILCFVFWAWMTTQQLKKRDLS